MAPDETYERVSQMFPQPLLKVWTRGFDRVKETDLPVSRTKSTDQSWFTHSYLYVPTHEKKHYHVENKDRISCHTHSCWYSILSLPTVACGSWRRAPSSRGLVESEASSRGRVFRGCGGQLDSSTARLCKRTTYRMFWMLKLFLPPHGQLLSK